jgi:hypothetical protein
VCNVVARLKREVPRASWPEALKNEGACPWKGQRRKSWEMTRLVELELFGEIGSNFEGLEENRDEQATVGGC